MARKKAEVKTEEPKAPEVKKPKKKTARKKVLEQEAPAVEKKLRLRNAPAEKPEEKPKDKPEEKIEVVEAEVVSEGDAYGGVGVNGNLVPLDQRTKNEQREICTAGGVASGKSRRQRKAIREFLNDFLDADAVPVLQKNMKALGVSESEMSNYAAMLSSLFSKAVNHADINAFRTLMEYAGRAPLQEMQENAAIAKMSQALQLAGGMGGTQGEDDIEDVVFYIPDNQRPIITDDDLVTVGDEA